MWILPAIALAKSTSAPTKKRCQAGSVQQIVERVCQTYRGHTLSARFEQTYVDAVTGAKPTERGQVALDARGRMRFAYEAPEEKIFVYDGQSAAFVEPDAKQVTVLDHFSESQAGAAISLLTGRLSAMDGIVLDVEASKAAQAASPASQRALVFRPKQPMGSFSRAELGIDTARCEIDSVRVIDAIGNASVYSLIERKLNAKLSDALFVRNIPKGFDVLHVDATPSAAERKPTEKSGR